jgi:hypothetical protein
MTNFDQIKLLVSKIDLLLSKIKDIKPNLYREYTLILDDSVNHFINLGAKYIEQNQQEYKLFLKKLKDIINILNFIVTKENIKESLRDWFKKEKWVRIDTQGHIAGDCGTMPKGKATQRCLPLAKAKRLTKAERAATTRKKIEGDKKGKQFVPNTEKAKVKFNK